MEFDQSFINDYFRNHWTPGAHRGISSPEQISKLVRKDAWLLDVGCGPNPFKNLLSNVVGIDPAFDQADVRCTIEEFAADREFDVATCLGSINFGTREIIETQIEKVVACLKLESRIFWRLNPGRKDHGNKVSDSIPFYPWTFEDLNRFAVKHGYKQVNETIEQHESRPRLYAEWVRYASK